jgi:hypothetical protein
LAGTETLLAKANTVGSRSRAQNLDGIRTGHCKSSNRKSLILLALPRGLEPVFSP